MHASYLVGPNIEFRINWLIMHKTSYSDLILNSAPSALLNMGAVVTFQLKCLEVLKFLSSSICFIELLNCSNHSLTS